MLLWYRYKDGSDYMAIIKTKAQRNNQVFVLCLFVHKLNNYIDSIYNVTLDLVLDRDVQCHRMHIVILHKYTLSLYIHYKYIMYTL